MKCVENHSHSTFHRSQIKTDFIRLVLWNTQIRYQEIFLKLILKHQPSFIRDYQLNHLLNKTDRNTFFLSYNVVNFFSTILHDYGIEAKQFPGDLSERTRKILTTERLTFFPQNNSFNFNENIYRQISGSVNGHESSFHIC